MAHYKQYPLVPGLAVTIHRLQGSELANQDLYIDWTGFFEANQGYVAVSRCKRLDQLHFIGTAPFCLAMNHPKYSLSAHELDMRQQLAPYAAIDLTRLSM